MTNPPINDEELSRLFQFKRGKWSLVVIASLRGGVYRFGEVQRRVGGLNQKTLAATLRALERDGFVTRRAYAIIPPRVEYQLTDIGLELLEFTESWRKFIASHRERVEAARRSYDEQNKAPSAP